MKTSCAVVAALLANLNCGQAWAETGAAVLGEVTVTGTREGQLISETPATVDTISGDEIRAAKASHPSQIMGRIPGVWVNVTGGEGHQTAIRQPLTTNPVYLYLEDGIPVRSTGFFNHNALYEINMPQAGGIEVSKGPGTALYGSDAIGGVVNVLTRPAPLKPEAQVSAEAGENGWKRLLASGGNTQGADGWRADLNLTKTDGWRGRTGYDRQSATLRWDRMLASDAVLKTVLTTSHIDQQTAGSSTISQGDYENNPSANYTPISFRKVKALRLSTAYEKEVGGSLLSITPYFRSNEMDLLANWSLGYDPTVYNTQNYSLGLLAKYRMDFEPYRSRVIVGVDIDRSPGSRLEKSIDTVKQVISGNTYYTDYTTGRTIYDYDVTFQGISPYIHGEMSPTERLRLTAGLRYDRISYAYDNKLSDANIVAAGKTYTHPADTDISYEHFSPKLGATYDFNPNLNGFLAYNHAFRAPSEGQLFRPAAGAAATTVDLKPVKADSYEIGLRGKQASGVSYEVSFYRMTKRDDILSYKDPVTSATQSVNAGKTLHQGVEVGAGAPLTGYLRLDVSYSYAKHTYEDWVTKVGATNIDYSGKEMETAPRTIANTRLSYAPPLLNGGKLSLEWVSLGKYWLDQANTAEYKGHDLFNLQLSYFPRRDLELFGSIMNLTDKRFAESASLSGVNPVFAPGLPRTIYAGLRYNWEK